MKLFIKIKHIIYFNYIYFKNKNLIKFKKNYFIIITNF